MTDTLFSNSPASQYVRLIRGGRRKDEDEPRPQVVPLQDSGGKFNPFAQMEVPQEDAQNSLETPVSLPPQSDPFRVPSRYERAIQPPIEGFPERPRTDSVAENLRRDVGDYFEGFKALAGYIAEEGWSALPEIAGKMPNAIYQSYKRWFDASKQGRLLEMMHAHPLEFVQDWSLPLSAVLSGGTAAVPKIFGTGATAGQVVKALTVMKNVSQAAEIVTDPIMGGASVVAQRSIGAAMRARKAATAVVPDKYNLNIGWGADTHLNAPPGERLKAFYESAQVSAIDANYHLRQLGRKGEQAKIEAGGGKAPAARTLTGSELEGLVRTYAGAERRYAQVIDPELSIRGKDAQLHKGFSDPNDFTKPLTRDTALIPELTPERFALSDPLKEVGEAGYKDLGSYSVARRVVYDLEPKGKTSGVDVPEASRALDDFDPMRNPDAHGDIHRAWVHMQQFKRDRMDYYQQAGMVSKEQAAAWLTDNPNHITFRRQDKVRVPLDDKLRKQYGTDAEYIDVVPDAQGNVSVMGSGGRTLKNPEQVVKAFKGSLRMIQDPLHAEAVMTARMMREVDLNQVMLAADKLADVEGSGVTRVEAPTGVSNKVTMDELTRSLDMEGVMESAIRGEDPLMTVNSPIMKPLGMPDNYGIAFKNGERTFLKFDDPGTAQAIASMRVKPGAPLDRFVSGRLMQAGRFAAKVKRAGITLEPGFTLGLNVIRDTAQASIVSKYGFIPIYDNARALFHYLGKSEMYDLWARSGGMQAHLSAIDQPVLQRKLRDYVHPHNSSYLRAMADMVYHPIQALQALQETSEAATRLGVFNRGVRGGLKMARGETLEQAIKRAQGQGIDAQAIVRAAAVESRDATVDFGMMGADPAVRALNSITAFQNAQLQSIDLLRRRMWEGPAKQRAAMATRAALGITLPSLALHLALISNDRAAEIYKDIPEVERDLFWHVMAPDWVPEIGGRMMRIPKPFEFGTIFGTLPVRAMEAVSDSDPSILTSAMKRISSDMQPLGIPTLFQPMAEIATNKNFFLDGPLTPRGQERFVPEERKTGATSEFARTLSKMMNGSLNPIEIDHIIYGYTGTAGRLFTQTTDPTFRKIRGGRGDVPAPRGGWATRVPVLNRLIANPHMVSQAKIDFFERLQPAEQAINTLHSISFDTDRSEFMRDHMRELKEAPILRRAADHIFKLGKAKNAIEASDKSADEKRKRLDELDRNVNRIAREVLKAVDRVK